MVKSNSKRKNTFPDSPLLYTHQANVARKLGESSTISAQTHKRLFLERHSCAQAANLRPGRSVKVDSTGANIRSFLHIQSVTQLSQLGGEAAFFEDISAYSFSISHKKLSNPAW